eukprot:jgi/Botrbrau1/722/Bobra.160_2s0045.1
MSTVTRRSLGPFTCYQCQTAYSSVLRSLPTCSLLPTHKARRLRRAALLRNTGVVRAGTESLDEDDELVFVTVDEDEEVVARDGDTVTVHFRLMDEDGNVLSSSHEGDGEPLTFEVGSGRLFGNELFTALDVVVRGLSIGQRNTLEAAGEPWNKDLLFEVPRDHPEIERLEGRYKNVGGLAEGLVVELSNGQQASIVELSDSYVRLDANHPLAGKTRFFELQLLDIDREL